MGKHASKRRTLVTTALTLSAALALAACGGAKVGDESTEAAGGGDCGTIDLAVSPWVGYQANASVIAYVAETELGCTVNQKNLKEELSWQGFASGEVDAIVENWGHEDLKKKYIEQQQVAVEAGSTGVAGVIGWFVPKWMVDEYPDITDWKNLDKYAHLFETSESDGKGQILDGDPAFVTNDEALVRNLDLDYKVVYSGSENALIEAFTKAQKQRTPLLGYFYEPHWLHNDVDLVRVKLPEHTPGCDADPQQVNCDYPDYDLDKIVSKEFADQGGPAYDLIKNFQWTNADQDQVATWIAKDKMSPKDAAKKWVEQNQDQVNAWLGTA